MKERFKKLLSFMLVLVLTLSLFTACGDNEDTNEGSNETSSNTQGNDSDEENQSPYDEFITVDVFSSQANYQGIQSGWFGEIVKEKFNMELNIIAPNVAGGGDTLFQTRSAAGNLGDIVMIGAENGRLADTVRAELMLDLQEYSDRMPHIMQYEAALDMIRTTIDSPETSIFAIPSSVSNEPATTPSEGLDLTFGPYLRWDYYTEIGSPKMSTLEDLLPVLKQMQDAYPTSDSGSKTYALSLFGDWDGNMMTLAKQPTCFYGYDELGFVLAKADGTDFQSIIESDSEYVRALKFYYEANQMGILDPESTTQNYDTLYNKYVDGAILFSPWPWLGQAAYNTTANKEAGKGFMIAPIEDLNIFSYGATPSGAKYVVGVGSKAQDPERMVDFLDWLYSPEGIMMSTAQTAGTCGPEGLTWELVDNKPQLTEFGKEALLNGDATMPEEWGGGSWKDGISQLNFTTVLPIDTVEGYDFPYDYTQWESVIELNSTPLDVSWQEEMGALSTIEYLEKDDQYVVAPGTDYIAPAEPSEISTLRAQCRSIIVENSWKMIYANDDAEFDAILEDMQNTVNEIGYNTVLEFDMEVAKEQEAARAEAR